MLPAMNTIQFMLIIIRTAEKPGPFGRICVCESSSVVYNHSHKLSQFLFFICVIIVHTNRIFLEIYLLLSMNCFAIFHFFFFVTHTKTHFFSGRAVLLTQYSYNLFLDFFRSLIHCVLHVCVHPYADVLSIVCNCESFVDISIAIVVLLAVAQKYIN